MITIVAAKFNIVSKTIDSFTDHIYKSYSDSVSSVSLVNSIDFTLDYGRERGTKLLSYLLLQLGSTSYVDNSGIVSVVRVS